MDPCFNCYGRHGSLPVPEKGGGSILLCIECFLKLQQAYTLKFNRMASEVNRTTAELDFVMGMDSVRPMQQVPLQTVVSQGHTVTYHNISIKGDNYGVVNSGAIQTLDLVVGRLATAGESAASAAFKVITEAIDAVDNSREIRASERGPLLEWLGVIAEEAAKPPALRKNAVAAAALAEVGRIVSLVPGLAETWKRCGPHIAPLFQE
jgi:hypothetical protein